MTTTMTATPTSPENQHPVLIIGAGSSIERDVRGLAWCWSTAASKAMCTPIPSSSAQVAMTMGMSNATNLINLLLHAGIEKLSFKLPREA